MLFFISFFVKVVLQVTHHSKTGKHICHSDLTMGV